MHQTIAAHLCELHRIARRRAGLETRPYRAKTVHTTPERGIMLEAPKCPVIALEEHYWDKELAARFVGGEGVLDADMLKRLYDLGEIRLREMDEAGIDMQILSHGAPSAQKLSDTDAVELTRRVNDRLHAAMSANPKRFGAFAALPTSDPRDAADELERTTKLGFKGPMIHGLANGSFLDDKRFWPIFERAQALDVPVYLHPAVPHPAVMDAYYKEYVKDFPMVIRAAWGFGETLPFLLWRIDQALSRPGGKALSFRQLFCEHFYITTSGNFSNPALLCCVMELGIDRILFAVDWPFVPNTPAVEWIKGVPLCDADKIKILSGNAKRLFRL